jgi:hypothetical protein
MRQILSDERIEKLDTLVSELRAISHWDAEYQRHGCPERCDADAYVSRQKRRREIIPQIFASVALEPERCEWRRRK